MQDEIEFHAAVERWRDTVFRVTFNYLRSRSDADDATQDVFVTLYRSNKHFESDEHLKAWLIRVTCNRCKSAFRSPWRRVENLADYAEQLSMTPASASVFAEVMALPQKYRVPVYLYYYEGYSTAEIAGILGMPAATVRTRLARARARLKEELSDD